MAKRVSCVNHLARASCPAQCRSMAKQDKSREEKLAKALRENLRRRKTQARAILPGTGRGTATRSGVVEGAHGRSGGEAGPLPHPSDGPPPRPGEE